MNTPTRPSAKDPPAKPPSDRLSAAIYRLSDTGGTLSTLERALEGHDDFSSTVRLVKDQIHSVKEDLAALADHLAA